MISLTPLALRAIHFGAPLWLLVGALVVSALTALELRLGRQRRKALQDFSARDASLTSSLSRPWRLAKAILKVGGVGLICVALARPQLGYREEETYRRGLDLMFVIDTSKSMLTPDLKPNRLTRAKLALYDLIQKFEGDRVGLVAFAGAAFLQCPLTLDRGMFDQTLEAVDTHLIPRGGTDLGEAIRVGVEALHSQPTNRKLLVVLTDGEDLEAGALAAARSAASAGVRIYTVGVGTPSGDLVPEPNGGFVKDASGAFVHSRLDEKTLTEIASVTGGQYRALGADGRGLELLYQDVLDKLPRDTVGERLHRIPLERFQWPLGLAALCLAIEALLGERRRNRRAQETSGPSSARPFRTRETKAIAAIAFMCLMGASARALASVSQAEQDYRAGKFSQAAEEYLRAQTRHPDDSRLQLNLGAANYKTGDFAAAGAALEGALHAAPDPEHLDLQQRAYYDLGNTRYRLGEQTLKAQPEKTMEAWKQAIASYDGALEINPKDSDAVFNRDLVQKKLGELEHQQQQKPKEPKDSPKSSDDKSQQAKGDQKNKADQQKSGQGKPDQQQASSGQGAPDQKQTGGQPRQAKNADGKSGQGEGQAAPQDQGQGSPKPGSATPANDQGKQEASPKVAQGNPSPSGQPQPGQAITPTTPEPGDASAQAAGESTPEEPAKPGQLSRADARALLNALRGDEKLMTAAGPENSKHTEDEPVQKDW